MIKVIGKNRWSSFHIRIEDQTHAYTIYNKIAKKKKNFNIITIEKQFKNWWKQKKVKTNSYKQLE